RTHAPFVASDLAARWSLGAAAVEEALHRLVSRGEVLAGEFRPGADGREYCHPDVLRALRRRSLAALRREVEAVPVEALARFLPTWQGVGSEARGTERLLDVVFTLQGLAIPASVIERDVLQARVSGYRPALLDELIAMGEVVWVGRGSLGPADGRVALYLRGDAPRLLPDPPDPVPGELQGRLREHLERRGASFFRDLYQASGGGDQEVILDALWDLVWAGEATN